MTTVSNPSYDPISALYDEMARQMGDAQASLEGARDLARTIAGSLRRTKRLVLLGMGGSHAVGRALEPSYRALGIDAIALPLSEQLDAPVPLEGRTVIVTSQSGESAEVLRWFADGHAPADTFGSTMEPNSSLARLAPSLIGAGGSEIPFAATRSLTVTLALHAAILGELGLDLAPTLEILRNPSLADVDAAVVRFNSVSAIVTSGRALQGVAEAIALGLTELSRLPCFSLEGGQLRHGPVEMLAPSVGVVMFRGDDPSADKVTSLAQFVAESDAPLILFDASGRPPVEGALCVPCAKASGLAAAFSILPSAQRFMVDFAASRVPDAGVPVRSSKVTRVE
ncbi:SIS domain-containing protein [Thioclava atlantica]|uniref:Glutamine--fructose-6-phosphate aminotransferase [isomerizing] n=1 Tax=Thioclava atlantica TaxID=1317124 RepID=A0A085U0E0_9RHOB|nr:aminotransferase [Thioclava atlantica]KFE36437.1 sugar isomerase (SIS) [Thioclava atlantica]